MPYTKSELRDVDFYKEFVEDLRNRYIDKMKEVVLPPTNSRKDGVLYSFEHILTGLGIENVFVTPNSFHNFMYEANVYDAREGQYTKSYTSYQLYEKGDVLDKVIDREISELTTPEPVGGTLPDGIKNGDRVAIEEIFTKGNAVAEVDVWHIEDNRKRKYLDKFTFFSSGFSKSTIKLVEPSALNLIVDGKDITVGWRGWSTDKASEGIY